MSDTYRPGCLLIVDVKVGHGFDDGHDGLDCVAVDNSSVLLALIFWVSILMDNPENRERDIFIYEYVLHVTVFAPDLTKYFNSLWKCCPLFVTINMFCYIFNWHFVKSIKDVVLHVWDYMTQHCWFAVVGKFSRFCISQLEEPEQILTCFWSSRKRRRERGMWLKKAWGWETVAAGLETKQNHLPWPVTAHRPEPHSQEAHWLWDVLNGTSLRCKWAHCETLWGTAKRTEGPQGFTAYPNTSNYFI